MQKVSQAVKRLAHYLRTDFKEIVNPSAMPNPTWHQKEPTKSLPEKLKVVRMALAEYGKGWRKFVTGKAAGEEDGKENNNQRHHKEENSRQEVKEGSHSHLEEDLGQVASELGQRGAESARPYFQRLYRTRMASYREALTEFSAGFGEGLAQDQTATPTKGKEEGK
jgi:hypothetical protein